jgi:WhiB family transcriptional regulator, redox-sensing transcriptional regulator
MHWPGTAAVLEGPAGFEAGFDAQSVRAGTMAGTAPATLAMTTATASPVATASSTATAGVPSGRDLPCGDDPELFFAESPEDVENAKSLCRGCPARIACLAGAVERREPWGVWGGQLFLRGEIVPRKRPRGRPRKTDVAA